MLELRDIKKDYVVEKMTTQALKGITLSFRKKEFVAILGPSGCGKTTLLNIIGGLDHYTSGDLIIDGVSTKQYKDRDWDTYRNHKIGFVFQTYNLIQHQRVGANVELALTISGVPKEERKERVKDALAQVGLASQIRKRPNTLSGGQMQRVAIARALVNNPDIILADEPTGALDSEASVRVMDILKNISNEHLVIMVTHNPELAYQYATRIIEIKDGEIQSDSNPVGEDEQLDIVEQIEKIDELEAQGVDVENIEDISKAEIPETEYEKVEESQPKAKKSKMKWKSGFMLSVANLYTKKMRTLATTFAGSIGIIGMTLVLALSTGAKAYILQVEESALADYPLIIEETNLDMSRMFDILANSTDSNSSHEANDQEVYEREVLGNLMTYFNELSGQKNDLKEIKKYLDKHIKEEDGLLRYDYGQRVNIFSDYDREGDGPIQHTGQYYLINPFTDNVQGMLDSLGLGDQVLGMLSTIGVRMDSMIPWDELIANQELLDRQYDVIAGHWPNDAGATGTDDSPFEVVLVVNENNEIDDTMALATGLRSAKKLFDAFGGDLATYQITDLLNMTYKVLPQSSFFHEKDGAYYSYYADTNYYTSADGATGEFTNVISNGLSLKIAGIVRPKPGVTNGVIKKNMGYTANLTKKIAQMNATSAVYQYQMQNVTVDENTGMVTGGTVGTIYIGSEAYSSGQAINSAKSMEDFASDYLAELGWIDQETPKTIYVYASSLDGKANILQVFKDYENSGEDRTLNYQDTISVLMNAIKQIINAITYVLVGFSAISLVVSSIMIAIITYTSVVERTREIGVLRALGARKSDIANIFNSETLIEGALSGIVGVFIAWIITLPINVFVLHKFQIVDIASLQWWHVLAMLALSVGLSFLAGLIPSQLAAKKDPVYALRSDQ